MQPDLSNILPNHHVYNALVVVSHAHTIDVHSGADAILLIAAVLPNQDLAYFMKAATNLGMQCLIEVHTARELARVLQLPGVENHILGINNRDLGTFKVDLGLTKALMEGPEGQQVSSAGMCCGVSWGTCIIALVVCIRETVMGWNLHGAGSHCNSLTHCLTATAAGQGAWHLDDWRVWHLHT
jgi:hypothetical protein